MASLVGETLGLSIYPEPLQSARISTGSSLLNPVLFAFDGVVGGTRERRLYVGSNDENQAYLGADETLDGAGILVSLYHPDAADFATRGFSWKLSAGDEQPTATDWAAISHNNTIDVGKIYDAFNQYDGTLSVYLPFWVQIVVPRNTNAKMWDSLKFSIAAHKMPVGWRLV